MKSLLSKSGLGIAVLTALVLQGCGGGGGGGGGSSSSGGPGGHPSVKTTSDVASVLTAYGQSVAFNSFTGYGPRLLTHGVPVFDTTLGLWYSIRVAPDATFESMFQDQAETLPAGTLAYAVNDLALTLSGTYSVTQGRYAGLTGTYLQSLQATGSNGSIAFSIPNVLTADSQFEIQTDSTGAYYGTATNGIALQSGYTQTQLVTYLANGASATTTTDSNSIKSAFDFTSTFTGNGTITGNDPGLPAAVTWGATGNGAVTYADGSIVPMTSWQFPNSPARK